MRKLVLTVALLINAIPFFAQTQVPMSSSSPIYYKDGKVGIGTTNPNAKLDLLGNEEYLNILKLGNSSWKCNQETAIEFWNGTRKGVATSKIISQMNNCGDGGENLIFQTQSPDSKNPNLTIPTTKLIIKANGKIGIGTTSPAAKLHVAGDILAKEIRVEDIAATNLNLNGDLAANNITVKANGNTADFVFSDTYDLKDLTEVESFIKTNKHLEGIPSAEAMEAQGVNLAEMNKLLLQKLEELTLYAIQQQCVIMKQDDKLSKLMGERNRAKEDMKSLEERLSKIETLLHRAPNP